MVQLPTNTVTQEDLNTWAQMQVQLSNLKTAEMLLRQKIFKHFFTAPTEGTNTAPLSEGWVLKATYPITRKVEMPLLVAAAPDLRNAGIIVEDLIRNVPELVISKYRTLTPEQVQLVDRVLTVKPGSPQMEIVQPKRAAK